jgi:hypothetical protein
MEPFLKQFLREELNRLMDDNKPVPAGFESIKNYEGIYDELFPQLVEELITET